MADKNDFLKAAQGILGGAQKVAAAVADKVENVAESVVGKDLNNDGSIGTEASEKLVSDVKAAAAVAAEKGKEFAGVAAEKGKEFAGVAAEKAQVAAGVAAEKAKEAAAAVQGALKKDEVVPAENVEVIAEGPAAQAAADAVAAAEAVSAAADEAAKVVEEAAEEK